MLHEIKDIIHSARIANESGLKTVLASVVSLEGSSYRKPGVRMSIQENGKMMGAVSGGCVEKEILRQAQSVFKDSKPKLMVYDGRYRLGCEGILYILIEIFHPQNSFFDAFEKQCTSRKSFHIKSYFSKKEEDRNEGGSTFVFNNQPHKINSQSKNIEILSVFEQTIQPGFQLIIVGSEHDSVELCKFASNIGWEVHIVAPPDDPKNIQNFPGARNYYGIDEKEFENISYDNQTAIVFMTHSYVKDVKYVSAARNMNVPYLGLLGPSKRREKLIHELLERYEDIDDMFFDKLHGPAGINIGAETPQEIAVSIISEILSVIRNQQPMSLKDKKTGIHQ